MGLSSAGRNVVRWMALISTVFLASLAATVTAQSDHKVRMNQCIVQSNVLLGLFVADDMVGLK